MEYDASGVIAQQEDNKLLQDILERNYYKLFRTAWKTNKEIEFIFNRKNKISQCYGCFNNTEPLLYPHIDFTEVNYDKIKNNLSAFVKYYIANEWNCNIDINGLDWANSKVSTEIMDILFNTFKYQKAIRPLRISIETDCRFLQDQELLSKWLEYENNFHNIGIELYFNIHANGLYCDDNGFDEAFYDKLLNFLNQVKYYHLITYIRPNNINNWDKNYKWWVDKLGDEGIKRIKLWEEKSDKWNYDLIGKYILFVNNQIDFFTSYLTEEEQLQLFFGKFIGAIGEKYPENGRKINFQNVKLSENGYLNNTNNNNDCNFFKYLTIDAETLNIVPCAKLNYQDYVIGQYVVENNEITGLKAENVPMIIYNTHLKQSCMPHCEGCIHLENCAGHCFAESYNKCFDMLVPIKEFCDLSKAKINFLIYKYGSMGILTKENLEKAGCGEHYIERVLNLWDSVQKGLQ